jgi:hypothetical protein
VQLWTFQERTEEGKKYFYLVCCYIRYLCWNLVLFCTLQICKSSRMSAIQIPVQSVVTSFNVRNSRYIPQTGRSEWPAGPSKAVFLNRRDAASIIPGPRLIKKEFTGPWSHKVWEPLV